MGIEREPTAIGRPTAAGRASVPFADRWFRFRDRVIANARFQAWAASFPLTRWAARRQANALFDLCAGFVYAQVLTAAVELDLFELVAETPLTIAEIAERTGLSLAAADRLITAAIALGLLRRRSGDRVGLAMMGAALVGNPGIAAMVRHHRLLYADLADPVALLRRDGVAGTQGADEMTAAPATARVAGSPLGARGTSLSGYWAYAGAAAPADLAAGDVAAYSDLMSQSQRMICGDILDRFTFGAARRVLDVGGGDGTFVTAAAARHPHISFGVFDLPAVADRARARFVDAGIADRATATGGDFFRDPLPGGADVITLVRVLFDHDDENVATVLRAARAALAPGGTLLIAEPVGGTPGAEAVTDAYYGFYLLAMGRGRTRSLAQLTRLLHDAGYARVRLLPTRRPFLTSLIAAQP